MTTSTAEPDTAATALPPARLIIVTPPAGPAAPAGQAVLAIPTVTAMIADGSSALAQRPPEPPPPPPDLMGSEGPRRLREIAQALTAGYVAPALREAGIDPAGVAVTFDGDPPATPKQLNDVVAALGFVTELGEALSVTFTAATRDVHVHLPDRVTFDGWRAALGAGDETVRDEELVGPTTAATACWGGWSIYLYVVGSAAHEAP